MKSITIILQILCVFSLVSLDSRTFLGNFTSFQHNIKGSLYSLGSQDLLITNFGYDGQGPSGGNSVYFYIVNSSYPYSPEDVERGYKDSQGFKVILPYPSDGKIHQYEDDIPDLKLHFQHLMKVQMADRHSVSWEDPLVLSLPEGIATEDITFLSVWCRLLGVNFGHVEFPLKEQLYG